MARRMAFLRWPSCSSLAVNVHDYLGFDCGCSKRREAPAPPDPNEVVIRLRKTDDPPEVYRYTPAGDAILEPHKRMLQVFLANGFKLAAHRETRLIPVYELVVAVDGPKLRESGWASL